MSLSIKCFEYFSLKSSFIFNRKMVALLGVGLTLSSYEAVGMDRKPTGEIITMEKVDPRTPKTRRQAVPDILAAFPAAKGEESCFSLAGYVHSAGNRFSPPSDEALTNRTNHSNASHSDVELDFRDGDDGDDGVGLTLMSTHLGPDDIAEIDNEELRLLAEEIETAMSQLAFGNTKSRLIIQDKLSEIRNQLNARLTSKASGLSTQIQGMIRRIDTVLPKDSTPATVYKKESPEKETSPATSSRTLMQLRMLGTAKAKRTLEFGTLEAAVKAHGAVIASTATTKYGVGEE